MDVLRICLAMKNVSFLEIAGGGVCVLFFNLPDGFQGKQSINTSLGTANPFSVSSIFKFLYHFQKCALSSQGSNLLLKTT